MNIPEDLFPEKSDVDLIMHLYSYEFSSSSYNTDLESKKVLAFWKRAISNYCIVNKTCEVTIQELHQYFTMYDIEPTSLVASFDFLLHQLRAPSANNRSSSVDIFGLLTSAWSAILNPLLSSLTMSSPIPSTKVNVYTPVIDTIVETLLLPYASTLPTSERCFYLNKPTKSCQQLTHTSSQLFTFKGFLQQVSSFPSSSVDHRLRTCLVALSESPQFRHIVGYLVHRGLATILRATDSEDEAIILTCASSSEGYSGGKTNLKGLEVALARLQLRYTVQELQDRQEEAARRCLDLLQRARSCKSRGDDKGALLNLALRKSAVANRERLFSPLLTLQLALESINSAEDATMLRDAYISAANGLRAAREGHGLTVESAEAARKTLEDETDELVDVSMALQSGVEVDSEEDEELLKELEEITSAVSYQAADNAVLTAQPRDRIVVDEYLPDISKLKLDDTALDLPEAPSTSLIGAAHLGELKTASMLSR